MENQQGDEYSNDYTGKNRASGTAWNTRTTQLIYIKWSRTTTPHFIDPIIIMKEGVKEVGLQLQV